MIKIEIISFMLKLEFKIWRLKFNVFKDQRQNLKTNWIWKDRNKKSIYSEIES